jgi:hypothetical protein
VDIAWNANNSKVKKELSMTISPLKETMEDSFRGLIDKGKLKEK